MGKKSAKNGELGKAIIKARQNLPAAKRKRNKLDKTQDIGRDQDINCVTVDDNDDLKLKNIYSVTEQNDLDDFLAKAELAGTEFTAQRMNIKVIDAGPNKFIGMAKENELDGIRLKEFQQKYGHLLTVPRRPVWSKDMAIEELQSRENEQFLNWRRQLAELEEVEQVVLTPFERNIEIWRQLWRVVERSHVVVQILDARNPLLFRNEDLEKYVHEIDKKKLNVLLLNKSDFLTEHQRVIWCNYFNQLNIRAIFWSAVDVNDDSIREIGNLKIKEEEEEEDSSLAGNNEQNHKNSSINDDEKQKKQPSLVGTTNSTFNTPQLTTRDGLINYFEKLKSHFDLPPGVVFTVGIVGYPNVGKSSTINKLVSRKKVAVSATPGKTKHLQTLFLNDHLMLCDCPGLVMPSMAMNKQQMLLSGILAANQMREHESVVTVLCSLFPRSVFERMYGLTFPKSNESENHSVKPNELLTLYAFARGFMSTKGLPDCSRAARALVYDVATGKLRFRCAAPGYDQSIYETFEDWLPQKKSRLEKPSSSAYEHCNNETTNNTFVDNKSIIESKSIDNHQSGVSINRSSQKTDVVGTRSETLLTVQKRHLLPDDEQTVTDKVDASFFGNRWPTIHVKKSNVSSLDISIGKAPKKLNRNKKKDKLRRIFRDLDA